MTFYYRINLVLCHVFLQNASNQSWRPIFVHAILQISLKGQGWYHSSHSTGLTTLAHGPKFSPGTRLYQTLDSYASILSFESHQGHPRFLQIKSCQHGREKEYARACVITR